MVKLNQLEWISPPAGQTDPLHPSAAIPGPVELEPTLDEEQIAVEFIQSLLSVPLGPPAHGTHETVAVNPAALTVPSVTILTVKQPEAPVAVYEKGTAGVPQIRPVVDAALDGLWSITVEFCVGPFPIVK